MTNNFVTCNLLTNLVWMEDERSGECSTYRTCQKLVQNFGRKLEVRKEVEVVGKE